MKKYLSLIIVAFTCCWQSAQAHDFIVDGIAYNINSDNTSVSVTYRAGVGTTSVREWGYMASLDKVTPEFLNGTTWVPMESREVSDFKMTVNLDTKSYELSFSCFGTNYSDKGALRM